MIPSAPDKKEPQQIAPTWEFRRAQSEDYSAILKLQAANYVGNLAEAERKDGFLSAEFTRDQVVEMSQDLGIMVAIDSGTLAGYLCAFRNDFSHGSLVLSKMFESYGRVRFEGKSLDSYSSYVYGPVCIARDYRRRGLLRGLYEAQKEDLAGLFEVGVAFVSRNNPHSLNAHIAGLGMTEAGEFELKGNAYVILVFPLPPSLCDPSAARPPPRRD
jgi:hypothetical protein